MKASTEELAAIKTQQGEDARRHSQSLVAAKSALDEVCDRLEILWSIPFTVELVAHHHSPGIRVPRPSANYRRRHRF